MGYQIECAGIKDCFNAYSRCDVLEWLKILKDETIMDIRKIYRNGRAVSVMEKYGKYINRNEN